MRVRIVAELEVHDMGGSAERSVHTPAGLVQARPGKDVLLEDPDGDCWVIPVRKFKKFCRPVEDETCLEAIWGAVIAEPK